MEHQTFNNKRIIWESRTSQILVVIGCFVFVAAAIFIHTQISILVFWVTVVFFGGGGLLTLRQLLNPNNLFVAPSPAFTQQKQAEQVRQKQENLGVFAYSVSGFSFTQILGTTYHDWTDIASIFGYKVSYHDDRCAIEEINLDIFGHKQLSITIRESTPGWHQFLNRLSEHIPAVQRDWVAAVAVAASAPHTTLLFDKRNRTKEEVEKECYQDKYDRQ